MYPSSDYDKSAKLLPKSSLLYGINRYVTDRRSIPSNAETRRIVLKLYRMTVMGEKEKKRAAADDIRRCGALLSTLL
jgi:hypothetical protein